MKTTLKSCTCVHTSQDKLHGIQLRVHNFATKIEEWRCTVCTKTKSAKSQIAKKSVTPP